MEIEAQTNGWHARNLHPLWRLRAVMDPHNMDVGRVIYEFALEDVPRTEMPYHDAALWLLEVWERLQASEYGVEQVHEHCFVTLDVHIYIEPVAAPKRLGGMVLL